MSSTPFAWTVFEAEAADPANHIAFTPVPPQRARRNGWTPERQQLFLFALLSGHHRDVKYHRDTAVARRHYRAELKAHDEQQADERQRAEAVWAEHQAILDRIELDRLMRRPKIEAHVRRL